MKVCIIAGREFFDPFDQRLFKEAKSLVKFDHDVTLLTPDKENKIVEVDGFKVICIKKSNKLGLTSYNILRTAKRLGSDVYHCHEFDTLIPGTLLKILTKKRIIYDSHEDYPRLVYEISKKKFNRFFVDMIERISSRFMDQIITIDKTMADRYSRFNKNVLILRNYPQLEYFTGQKKPVELEKMIDTDKDFIFVYVGNISLKRGILVMLSAMEMVIKRHKNVKLLLIGMYHDEESKRKTLDFIKAKDLERNVIFSGWVDYRELAGYLSVADAAISLLQPLPRLKTIFPSKLFEYLITKKPIIISNFQNLKQMVDSLGCGLTVNPTDAKQVAEAMLYLVEHPKEARAMGESGFSIAKKKYTWEVQERDLMKIYERFEK